MTRRAFFADIVREALQTVDGLTVCKTDQDYERAKTPCIYATIDANVAEVGTYEDGRQAEKRMKCVVSCYVRVGTNKRDTGAQNTLEQAYSTLEEQIEFALESNIAEQQFENDYFNIQIIQANVMFDTPLFGGESQEGRGTIIAEIEYYQQRK